MILLYYLTRLSLAVLHLLVSRRAMAADRLFTRLDAECKAEYEACKARVGGDADAMDRTLVWAEHSMRLAKLGDRKRRAEIRYDTWEARGERLGAWRTWIAAMSGSPLLSFKTGVLTVLEVSMIQRYGPEAWSWACEAAQQILQMWGGA